MSVLRVLQSRQALPARLARLFAQQQQQKRFPLVAAQNMPPNQLTRPGQSQSRWLSSQIGPTSASGTPPPPSSEEALPSLPAATTFSTSQLRPGKTSSVSRTAQIARHLSSPPAQFRSYSTGTMASQYNVRKVGAPHTLDHRVYIEKDGVPVSPFHDIPLYANAEQTILNMVVEIPRWTNAKLEVRTKLPACLPFVCFACSTRLTLN